MYHRYLGYAIPDVPRVPARSYMPRGQRLISLGTPTSSQGVAGVAFFDRRIIRSMPVTYMAVVNPSGTIGYVDILCDVTATGYYGIHKLKLHQQLGPVVRMAVFCPGGPLYMN